MTVKENCDDPESKHCQHNSVKIVSSFVGLGEYLSGAIGKCSVNAEHSADALCAQMSLRLVKHLGNVDRASVAMAKDCDIGATERLYLENDDGIATQSTGNTVTLALA